METDKVNRLLTLATNLAVVVGIGFLVIEVQQNTAAIRGQAPRSTNVDSSLSVPVQRFMIPLHSGSPT